jgi:DNA-binding transcriptional LysR family regulator
MASPDLNLLYTLDVLLSEGSVAGAARRLRLSPSAMSRALARLRAVTGDQLLVRAGRGLVPTPRAGEMRERVRELVQDAQVLLRPAAGLDLTILERTFTLRASDGFAETFGPSLIRRVSDEAPGVALRFVRKLNKDSEGLRTVRSTSRPGSWPALPARKCGRRPCSPTAMSGSFMPTTRSLEGRSLRPIMQPMGT